MILYRVCDKSEIDKIICNRNFFGIGNTFKNNLSKCSFNYKENTLYMHFFDNIENILYLNTNEGRCICTYNIPDEIIEEYFCYGKYLDVISFLSYINVRQYAVPNSLMSFDYLLSIELLTSSIDIDDLINEEYNEYTKKLYIK